MLSKGSKLHENERKLFKGLGFENYIKLVEDGHWFAVYAFKQAAYECFIQNKPEDAYTRTLRACVRAIESCKIYLETPEWEELFTELDK